MKKIGLIVFISALAIGVTLASLTSFGRATGKIFSFNVNWGGEKGSGNVKTENRRVSDFKAIDVSGAFEVEITAQKDFSLEVEADDNLLPLIKTEVDGETLQIRSEKRFSTSNPLKIRISAPDIDSLDLSGASKVNLVNLNNDGLKLDSSGASKIKVEGTTGDFDVEMSGASRLDAENLKAENVSVDSSGASNAMIFVTNELRADLSGATNVTYSGNPKSVQKKTSGASWVKEK
ncbi:MAG TPA: head GIN domain-containing protein [Pyrinomonadaceae bacterium]|jgi:hypothetical protein